MQKMLITLLAQILVLCLVNLLTNQIHCIGVISPKIVLAHEISETIGPRNFTDFSIIRPAERMGEIRLAEVSQKSSSF